MVHDDLFTTVSNFGAMNVDDDDFDEGEWRKLVSSGHEHYVEDDMDRDGKPISIPHLHNEWLTNREVQHRNAE